MYRRNGHPTHPTRSVGDDGHLAAVCRPAPAPSHSTCGGPTTWRRRHGFFPLGVTPYKPLQPCRREDGWSRFRVAIPGLEILENWKMHLELVSRMADFSPSYLDATHPTPVGGEERHRAAIHIRRLSKPNHTHRGCRSAQSHPCLLEARWKPAIN